MRIRVLSVLLVSFFLFLPSSLEASTESDSARVGRLFVYASSGEVRHRDLVQPGKDSLIAMGERSAPWLARKLDATDARERLTLADIFEKIGAVAVLHLAPYLDSSGEYRPKNAARCLGGIKDTSATLPLLPHLDHPRYAVRSEVATALGKIADPRAAMPLTVQLDTDFDSDVRKSCVVALGTIGDSAATGVLIAALSDEFFGVRQSAIEALGKLKPTPCAHLIEAAHSLDSVAQHGAIVALGACTDIVARQELATRMKHLNPLIRGFAIEGFGHDTTQAVRVAIAQLLEFEADPFVRAQIERVIRNSAGH